MQTNYSSFAKSSLDFDPSKIDLPQEKLSKPMHDHTDPLVANFIKSQMIAKEYSLSRNSLFNYDGFLEKVEDKTKQLLELVTLNFDKAAKDIKLDKIQTINLEKEDDDDDPCFIFLCTICSSFKSVYPVQCLKCEKIYCVECSRDMIANQRGCFCGLKPYEEVKIGPIIRQTIDKFKIKCPNLQNRCSKIMNFERINHHLSQDCLSIDYKYTCIHCKTSLESNFWGLEKLRDHLNKCPETNIKCESCEKDVIRKSITEHYQTCDLRNITCEDCEGEMVFADYKNKHSKAICLKIIRNKFYTEMQAIREENTNLKNENERLRRELENKSLDSDNFDGQKHDTNPNLNQSSHLDGNERLVNARAKSNEQKEMNRFTQELDLNSPRRLRTINLLAHLIRSFIARKNFTKAREALEKRHQMDIESLKIQYTSSNILKAENSRQVQYSKTGWKKFYPHDHDKFSQNYGKTLTVKLIVLNGQEIYSGEINYENQKHGFGVSITKRGCKYTGYWFKNSFEGWGEYIDADGNIYQGLFANYKLNGKGEKFSLNGNYYEGDYIEGVRNGFGREETNEHIYVGQYENDKKNQKGKIVYKNMKDSYEGDFLGNKITGKGQYCWENGDVFIGDFINGKMHGRGLYKWPDGGEYDGEYVNNFKEGKGKFKWSNGKIFEGPFLSGKPHGKGVLMLNNKNYEVEFSEGKMINKKTIKYN